MAVRNTSMFTSAPTTNPSSCTGVSLHQEWQKGHHWCLKQGHRDGGLSFQPKEVPTTRQTLYREMAKDQLSIYIRLSCLQDPRRGGDLNRPVLAATGEMNLGQDIMHWNLMDGSVCRIAEYILHHEMAKIYIPAHSAEAPAALLSTRTPTPVSDFLPPHHPSEFSDFYQLPFWKSEDGTPTPGVSNQAFAKNEKSRLWNTASALSDFTLLGWEFQYLLDQTMARQICIRTRCIRRAQPLDIDFRTHLRSWIMSKNLETILPMI